MNTSIPGPETVYDGNTTTVTVDASNGLIGVGVARCRPDDAFSKRTGQLIAFGRAIQDVGRQIEAIGDSTVVTNAEVDRVLDLIDEIADEEGQTVMPVGSTADAQVQDKLAKAFFDEMFIGSEDTSQKAEASTSPSKVPTCGNPACLICP